MNFIEEFKKGQAEKNKGLYMGDGLSGISKAINGVQRKRIYGIASAPKIGKSTFVDYGFVISPYLEWLKTQNVNIEWIYFSFEIDRVSKEFDFATYFLYHDYGIEAVSLEEGQTTTINGEKRTVIDLSPDYLRGRLLDDNNQIIKVKPAIMEVLKEVYANRIIPLFGEYSDTGSLITPGKITFIEEKENPTGVRKFLMRKAEREGKFVHAFFGENGKKIIGYQPDDPDKITIVIIDHLRKLPPERGFTLKQTVDKMIEYCVELRNWCGYTFAPIIHTNRSMSDVDRMKYAKDELFPTSEDIKDTGNLSEDADYMFTIFNPNDEKFHLSKHFGMDLKDRHNNPLYPNLRTIHLVESRHTFYPQHFKTIMRGNLKAFELLK